MLLKSNDITNDLLIAMKLMDSSHQCEKCPKVLEKTEVNPLNPVYFSFKSVYTICNYFFDVRGVFVQCLSIRGRFLKGE